LAMEVLIAVVGSATGFMSFNPEMVENEPIWRTGLLEGAVDLKRQAIETDDVEALSDVSVHIRTARPPCWDGRRPQKRTSARRTPQQVTDAIAQRDVMLAVNRTGNLLH